MQRDHEIRHQLAPPHQYQQQYRPRETPADEPDADAQGPTGCGVGADGAPVQEEGGREGGAEGEGGEEEEEEDGGVVEELEEEDLEREAPGGEGG